MNNYQVIEAIVDDGHILLNPGKAHASFTWAYLNYPIHIQGVMAYDRLHVIDLRRQVAYTWHDVERLMVMENLARLDDGRPVISDLVLPILETNGYIDEGGKITNKGHDLLQELRPKPALTIHLEQISSTTQIHKTGTQ